MQKSLLTQSESIEPLKISYTGCSMLPLERIAEEDEEIMLQKIWVYLDMLLLIAFAMKKRVKKE